jgi:hypothetical protein
VDSAAATRRRSFDTGRVLRRVQQTDRCAKARAPRLV